MVSVRQSLIHLSHASNSCIGTHDIINSITIRTVSDEVNILTRYSDLSEASGALYAMVAITNNGMVDSRKSALLPLDRYASEDITLPFSFPVGQYGVFSYDIGGEGVLSSGFKYPAFRDQVETTGSNRGAQRIHTLNLCSCFPLHRSSIV